jgi:hypothetical protein
MYRSLHSMFEGWTKNLALLFPNPLRLAAWRGTEFVAILGLPAAGILLHDLILVAIGLAFYANFLFRVSQAHFPWRANLLALFGLPIFVLLLVRSYIHMSVRGAVSWKGRQYPGDSPERPQNKH